MTDSVLTSQLRRIPTAAGWREKLGTAIPRSTTAALEAVGNAINTTDKFEGKTLINTTAGTIVTANGAAAADVWLALDGTTAHTPV